MPDALFWSFWVKNILVIWVYVSLWFLVRLIWGREKVGLASFGLGLVLCVWTTFYWLHNLSWAAWIVTGLVTITGLWQTYAVMQAPKLKKIENKKDWVWYVREYGDFLLRGILIVVVVLPAIQAILGYATLSALFYWGMFIWFVGIGLSLVWKVTHLGEVVQWLGIYTIALTTAESWWTILSPTLLLVVFSSKHSEKLTGENLIKK